MLTNISNTNVTSGYPVQQIRRAEDAVSELDASVSPLKNEDEVTISREARKLDQSYDEKERNLEESYTKESEALEREYLQEKKRLERELSQKKQSLGISIFA